MEKIQIFILVFIQNFILVALGQSQRFDEPQREPQSKRQRTLASQRTYERQRTLAPQRTGQRKRSPSF
jgi:hypothetical protein